MNNKSIKSKKVLFSLLMLGVLFASAFIVKCSTTEPDEEFMQPYFVAVSDANSAAYSKDGTKWEFVEDAVKGKSIQFNSICYGKDDDDNNIFVAVGSGISYYSIDGVNWEEGKGSELSSNNWQSVCYGNGIYVAVDSSNQKVMSSYNGKDWSLVVSVPNTTSYGWGEICYGADKFVMIEGGSNNMRNVVWSNNGSSWFPASNQLLSHINFELRLDWNSICYGNGKFIAVASTGNNSGTQMVAESADGKDWATAIKSTLPNSNWQSVCYGEDKFVAVGYIDGLGIVNDGTIAYSFDGEIWHEVTKPETWMSSVCYGNNKFVAISTTGIVNYSSNNGVTWRASNENLTPSPGNWSSICFGYVDAKALQRRVF